MMRSFLFVPGDAPDKMHKALKSGADALILDLEDSVAGPKKDEARRQVAAFLQHLPAGPMKIFVRANGLRAPEHCNEKDLDAVLPWRPFGIMLPKAEGGADIQQLSARLNVREAQYGFEQGSTCIFPLVTETAAALFHLGSYTGCSTRLFGLTWGGEDLSAALGVSSNRDEAGAYTPPFQLARLLTIFAAAAASVPAIDAVYPRFKDEAGLQTEIQSARRDGFTAKLAIHPAQIPAINAGFTPTAAEIERAQAICDAFANAGNAGAVSLDGDMLDAPHLLNAQRLLERHSLRNNNMVPKN